MKHISLIASFFVVLGVGGTFKPPSGVTDLSKTVFAKDNALRTTIMMNRTRLQLVTVDAKRMSFQGKTYYAVPFAENPDPLALRPFVQIAVFLANKRALNLLAIVPKRDPNFRYGYGFSQNQGALFLIRPSPESSKICCKYNRVYLYSVIGHTVRLRKTYLQLNTP